MMVVAAQCRTLVAAAAAVAVVVAALRRILAHCRLLGRRCASRAPASTSATCGWEVFTKGSLQLIL